MSSIYQIKKRDGSVVRFELNKIAEAVLKAMTACNQGSVEAAHQIALQVEEVLLTIQAQDRNYVPSIEGVQNMVENALMSSEFHDTAKAYILYRDEQARKRKKNIFEKRINLKPYEYPEVLDYVDAIRHSYWVHTEFNFTSDIQDFKSRINETEREAIKRTMLAISQIEVAVKTFWGNIYDKMPKPEIGSVGATFSESEVRHSDAYSHLLEILGLNEEFENLKKNPVIMRRVNYLENSLKYAKSNDNREYSEAVLLFALFIEHVSLFSQFLIIMAFNKHRNVLKGISNVVEATSKEEQIHGMFGIDIIKIIKKENPDWFDEYQALNVQRLCRQAFDSESEIVDWIFEKGELDFLDKQTINEFIKDRFNRSLVSLDIEPVFETDKEIVKKTSWFDDEILTTKHVDFFVKRSINYNKSSQSITAESIFDFPDEN